MYQMNSLIALGSILTCFLIYAQAADKYTDENRPYEFGFTIDGEQHRHEKKDKNGIIMGEFGFITADGVYHVTVYATDEQGRFKVLSMKNIRVKPYPAWHPKTSERQGHSLSLPPSQESPVSQVQAVSNQPPENQFKQVSIEPPANSCSHCSLPTTTTRAPKIAIPSYNQQNINNPLYSSAALENTNFQNVQPAKSLSSFPSPQNTPNLQTPGFSQNNPQRKPTDNTSSQFQHELNSPQQKVNAPQNYPQQVFGTAQNYPQEQQNNPQPSTQQVHRNPQQDNEAPPIYLNEKQNDLYNPQTSSQQGLGSPQQAANTDQTYPQQHSEEPQYYSAGQQNSLNGPQVLSQPGSITSHQETNTEHTYPQQVSAPAQINPSEQQNSLNSPQIFQQALDNPQRAYSQEDSGLAQNYPAGQQNSLNIPQTSSHQGFGTSQNSPSQQSSIEQNYPLQDHAGGPKEQGGVVPLFPEQVQNPNLQTQHGSATGERTPKVLNDFSEQPFDLQKGFSLGKQPLSKKPTLFAAQMQIVDKNTDIYHIAPGEKEGLPEGLQKDEITQLLYTFNYTLAFQGHFEEGYTNGVKQGYYFVTGRNGVRTRVDYVADANGFRPKITQEVLDLLSDDVPKPETEKDEKYGLKGYEFKWLYYPVETKTR